MRLFHFSNDPVIDAFKPRPVQVPSTRAPGMEWLNGPLVWAIEEKMEFLYLFPRDCPRIVTWADHQTNDADKAKWLFGSRVVAFVERSWFDELQTASLYRYELPSEKFVDLNDAGMWVSDHTVTPFRCDALHDLPKALFDREVDLRIVDSLAPLKNLWSSTLNVSGIRLRNAQSWKLIGPGA